MNDNIKKYKTAAFRILALEAMITVLIAVLLFVSIGRLAAVSAVVGGAAFILPNAYFAKYVFRHSAADSARVAVWWFYVGEVIKIIVTVLIFTAGFMLIKPLNMAALFITYIVMLILNLWGNSILMSR